MPQILNRTGATLHLLDVAEGAARGTGFVLKASFALAPGAPATLLPPERQRAMEGDRPHMDELGRGPAWTNDLVLRKPHTDVIVLGQAHAPGGTALPNWVAGLRCGPLERAVQVWGPRHWRADGTASPAVPVASVPLRWELAFGGLNDPRNPYGIGLEADASGLVPLPRIEDPAQPMRTPQDRPDPVNLGPVPLFFAERQARLGTRDQRWILFRAPLPPDDFDPAYWNAAPARQQVGNHPRGDEKVVLVNLHAGHPQLETALPGLRLRVAILDAAGAGTEIAMALDTLLLLPDEDEMVLLWRGHAPVAQAALQTAILLAEFEPLAEPPQPIEALLAPAREAQEKSRKPDPAAEAAKAEAAAQQAQAEALAQASALLEKADLPLATRAALAGGDATAAFDALMAHATAELRRLGATGV